MLVPRVYRLVAAIFVGIGTFVSVINLSLPIKALLAGTVFLVWVGYKVYTGIGNNKKTGETEQVHSQTISYSLLGVILVILVAGGYKYLEERLTPRDVVAKSIYYMLVLDASEAMQEPFDGFASKWEAVQSALQEFYTLMHPLSNYGLVVIGGQNSDKDWQGSPCAIPDVPTIPLGSVSKNDNVRINDDLSMDSLRQAIEPQQPQGGGSLRMAFSKARNQLALLPQEKIKIIILIANAYDACKGEIDVDTLIEDSLLTETGIAVHKELILFADKNNPGLTASLQGLNQPGGDSPVYIQVVGTYDELLNGIENILIRLESYYPPARLAEVTQTMTMTETATHSNGYWVITLTKDKIKATSARLSPTATCTLTSTGTMTLTPSLTFTSTFTFTPSPIIVFPPTTVKPKDPKPPPPPLPTDTQRVRCGALCNDGTTTTATGGGACSSHDGVKEWLYPPNCP